MTSTDQTITATQANDMAVTGTWYHLTATFNGGGQAAGDAKLYVDGVVNSSALNASFLGLEDVTSDLPLSTMMLMMLLPQILRLQEPLMR